MTNININIPANLSQFKKWLSQPGATVILTECVFNHNHKDLNIPRTVEKLQTNAVKFAGGSWLYFDGADHFKFNSDSTFEVGENNKWELKYKYYLKADGLYPV